MSEKTEARQTPLPDLLDRVPEDIVLGIKGDEPMFPSYTNIPIGALARQAAAKLRRLHAENKRIGPLAERVLELKAQRDALLEEISALREVLLYSLDNQGRYRKKHRKIVDAAIKAVEGEKE